MQLLGHRDEVAALSKFHRGDVEIFQLWGEPVMVALPERHPLAAADGVRLGELAQLALRLPSELDDLALSSWIRQICQQAGFAPRLGRPADRLSDALVEIGNGEDAWTVLAGCSTVAEPPVAVALRRLLPESRIPVLMVVPAARSSACVRTLLEAFDQRPAATQPA